MAVVGVLTWYDESPSWLAGCITSYAPALDSLVALDGGYALFPGALDRPASRVEEASTVLEVAAGLNLPLTLYRPGPEPFIGNEVEKRNLSVQLALPHTTDNDWLVIIDSDFIARFIAEDFKAQLAAAEEHCAEYTLTSFFDAQVAADTHGQSDMQVWHPEGSGHLRGIFRALRTLRFGPAHYVISAEINEELVYLWGDEKLHHPYVTDVFDASALLKVDHRAHRRHRERDDRRRQYYAHRDATGAERLAVYDMERV